MAMTNDIFAILAWLAGACFCGIVPLGFATILLFTSRKRGKVGSAVGGAKRISIAAVKPGVPLLRLEARIMPMENAIDGSPENALVFLRLKIEVYESDSDSSGWRGLTEKTRGIPFQLEDATGSIWVNPDGLDKQLLGDGMTPNEDQIQAACILLGISPKILRGKLRFSLWELRAGQQVSVIGGALEGQQGLEISRIQNQPFIISPLLGEMVDNTVISETRKSQVWTLILGIPGLLFLLCGLTGALVAVVRLLVSK
jgi:hypothetical protein